MYSVHKEEIWIALCFKNVAVVWEVEKGKNRNMKFLRKLDYCQIDCKCTNKIKRRFWIVPENPNMDDCVMKWVNKQETEISPSMDSSTEPTLTYLSLNYFKVRTGWTDGFI